MRLFFALLALIIFPLSLVAQTSVLVSIAPQKFLVEQLGGETVSVQVIVPPGACSHSYDPTPKQALAIQDGEIWFRLGESFEEPLLRALQGCKVVDQREGLPLLGDDPHIWLSPRLLKSQAIQITDTLCAHNPEHTYTYKKNLYYLLGRFSELDKKISSLVLPTHILVSHPAYGYFCHDYGIEQLSIEMEGKAPTPRYLTRLILQARHEKIETIYLQAQHSVKGGERVAKELNAQLVHLDPYVEDVIENLETIAHAFCR